MVIGKLKTARRSSVGIQMIHNILPGVLILYDDIYKNSLTDVKKDFCFENGKVQARNFNDGFSNIGEVNFASLKNGIGKGFGSLLGSINPVTAAIGLAVAGTVAFGKHVLALEQKFTKLRGEIQKTTGAVGLELDTLTENTEALVNTFGDDQGEVIRSQNTLMKTFGLTAKQAYQKLQDGYLSGANAQGDLLDSVTEYSTQIKAAGGNAGDLMRILDKSQKAGIFSDKGVDAVKEFNLRIKEQTKPARDALQNAFGKKFTDKIFGKKTVIDSL